jgi:hypothetical protein
MPARLPAAVNSLARSAECRPAHRNPAILLVCVHGIRPLARTSGNPASNLHQIVFLKERFRYCDFFGTRGASKRDAVGALKPQSEERTSRSAPNFGCPAATFWNTA